MVNIYELALAKTFGIGSITAKALIDHFGSAEALFCEDRKSLEIIFKSKTRTIDEIINRTMFAQCEQELEFMQRYGINSFFFANADYPNNLKQIADPPICIFFQGNGNLNAERIVAIVGSRKITDYGKQTTLAIVEELRRYNATIVSGLAYGVDTASHIAALDRGMPTFGVLGHGLDMIYPRENFDLAQKMKTQGGIVSEYFSKTKMNPSLFPQRNRIIAGLSHLTIVIEATFNSGALITARIANSYNREVMAVPGRLNDTSSEGCNAIIDKDIARIISRTTDIARLMHWDKSDKEQAAFDFAKTTPDLPPQEAKIYKIIADNEGINIDELTIKSKMNTSQLASALLNLEINNHIRTLPGKCFGLL
ncbi:MAG: DNA-processing protein DprA [Bacteroidales bacterium]|jgi:DNA processing protein|nr:DNA-processing protein DprA [Bacteroidales bacterium]